MPISRSLHCALFFSLIIHVVQTWISNDDDSLFVIEISYLPAYTIARRWILKYHNQSWLKVWFIISADIHLIHGKDCLFDPTLYACIINVCKSKSASTYPTYGYRDNITSLSCNWLFFSGNASQSFIFIQGDGEMTADAVFLAVSGNVCFV